MGLLECASYMSKIRGYDYYKEGKVQNLLQITQSQYSAQVVGNSVTPYDVFIDIAHPRKSKCNCPHAYGRRIVCKHMLALYFTAFPDEATPICEMKLAYESQDRYDEWDEYDEEEADYISDKVTEYVCNMKKSDLQQALLQVLFDGPEWQYDRFIEEYCIDCD